MRREGNGNLNARQCTYNTVCVNFFGGDVSKTCPTHVQSGKYPTTCSRSESDDITRSTADGSPTACTFPERFCRPRVSSRATFDIAENASAQSQSSGKDPTGAIAQRFADGASSASFLTTSRSESVSFRVAFFWWRPETEGKGLPADGRELETRRPLSRVQKIPPVN